MDFSSAKANLSAAIVVLFGVVGIYYIEYLRQSQGITDSAVYALLDRIGEFATLSVVHEIFASRTFDGFKGFENLRYLYLPSVFFPEKPIINDGAEYVKVHFGLGRGYAATRFPVLLHIDAYRRFGWLGLAFAWLPALSLYLMIRIGLLIRRISRAPWIGLVVIKLAIFMYPKSILGLIEITLYTLVRSSVIFVLVYLLFSLIRTRRAPRGA